MPSAKPRYKGDGLGAPARDFSEKLKKKLRALYPGKRQTADSAWGDTADRFVEEVLDAAREVFGVLHRHAQELEKQDIRAERDDLAKTLHAAETKLRSVSLELDQMLGREARPRDCADEIALLVAQLECIAPQIDALPRKRRCVEQEYEAENTLALHVLPVLQSYDIRPAATGNPSLDNASPAIEILSAIGTDIGIVRSIATWREIVRRFKR
jgi:hypothetical protein